MMAFCDIVTETKEKAGYTVFKNPAADRKRHQAENQEVHIWDF